MCTVCEMSSIFTCLLPSGALLQRFHANLEIQPAFDPATLIKQNKSKQGNSSVSSIDSIVRACFRSFSHNCSTPQCDVRCARSIAQHQSINSIKTTKSKQGHSRRINIINILTCRLNPIRTSAKNTVPKPRLLPIVMALPPSLPMMQIMVLDHDIRIKHLQ